jgi:hypothetical protein
MPPKRPKKPKNTKKAKKAKLAPLVEKGTKGNAQRPITDFFPKLAAPQGAAGSAWAASVPSACSSSGRAVISVGV